MNIADPRQVPTGIFAYTLHPTRLEMLTEGATTEERAMADADPAVKGGVFRATVYPYQPMLMGEWPPEAATLSAAST